MTTKIFLKMSIYFLPNKLISIANFTFRLFTSSLSCIKHTVKSLKTAWIACAGE